MSRPTYGTENFSTTLNVGGGINNSQTTGIILTSVSGLNTSGGILGIDWASTIDTSTYEEIEYTGISGNTLTGVTRGMNGLSAKAHSNGATIVAVVSSTHINRLADKLRGVDTSAIDDANGNSILKTSTIASAVNQVTVQNAATGNAPQVQATGTDNNIDLNFVTKGTGVVKFNGVAAPTTSGSTDGWTADTNTWTYVSSTSFKVSGVDVTTTFTKGTRIKCTNSTVKYFVVTASSFSTDTTITVTGGSDYTLANAAISSPYYSYQASPQGYPVSFNWTPSYATDSTGFTNAPSSTQAFFSVLGNVATLYNKFTCNGTSGGAGSILITGLPITPANNFLTGWGTCLSTSQSLGVQVLNSPVELAVNKYDGTTIIANSNKIGVGAIYTF